MPADKVKLTPLLFLPATAESDYQYEKAAKTKTKTHTVLQRLRRQL
jgi:hypothetical protein